jgi:hypothetical protein
MTTHVARGTRGDYNPHACPGDLTGRRFLADADRKADYETAIRATKNALQDEPIELVPVGPRVYAVPRVVAEHFRTQADD